MPSIPCLLIISIVCGIVVIAAALYQHRWSGGEFEQKVERWKR